jgi:hypothetical protein
MYYIFITQERVDFQKVAYNYDSDRNSFVRLDYPTSGMPCCPLLSYCPAPLPHLTF